MEDSREKDPWSPGQLRVEDEANGYSMEDSREKDPSSPGQLRVEYGII